jgi:hypothetical protein
MWQLSFLAELTSDVMHMAGRENMVADALLSSLNLAQAFLRGKCVAANPSSID